MYRYNVIEYKVQLHWVLYTSFVMIINFQFHIAAML